VYLKIIAITLTLEEPSTA